MFQDVVQSWGALANLWSGIVFANLSYQIFQCSSSYFGETKDIKHSHQFLLVAVALWAVMQLLIMIQK